jgi:hypothetical protein
MVPESESGKDGFLVSRLLKASEFSEVQGRVRDGYSAYIQIYIEDNGVYTPMTHQGSADML